MPPVAVKVCEYACEYRPPVIGPDGRTVTPEQTLRVNGCVAGLPMPLDAWNVGL